MIKSNLKKIMEQAGVTYSMLEEATGLSSRTITRARGDKIIDCRLSTLHILARALGVSTKELYVELPSSSGDHLPHSHGHKRIRPLPLATDVPQNRPL